MYSQTEFSRDSWEVKKALAAYDKWCSAGGLDYKALREQISQATGWSGKPLDRLYSFICHLKS